MRHVPEHDYPRPLPCAVCGEFVPYEQKKQMDVHGVEHMPDPRWYPASRYWHGGPGWWDLVFCSVWHSYQWFTRGGYGSVPA